MSSLPTVTDPGPVPEVEPVVTTVPPAGRWIRAATAALAAALTVYAVVASGVLGVGGLGLLLLLVLAAPVAPTASARLALVGTAALGWVPATWWVRWPVPLDHGALLAALLAGGIAAWVLWQPSPRLAVQALRPELRWVDCVPFVVSAASVAVLGRFLVAASPRSALSVLLPGYDNVGHFSMFETLRSRGAVLPRVEPSGSPWHYSDYPQGFHAVAATFADVVGAGDPGPAGELPVYAHAIVMVVAASLLCLSAACCALPVLRARPVLVVPAVAVLAVAALLGTGGSALADGFAPFWFATCLVSLVVLLALGAGRLPFPATMVAIGGALVGIAYSWAPLILLAAPALVLLVRCDDGSGRHPLVRHRLSSVVVVLATAAAVGTVGWQLVGAVGVDHVVTSTGGISKPEPHLLLSLVALTVLVPFVLAAAARRASPGPGRDFLLDVRWLLLVVVSGAGSALLLLVDQLRATGTVSYYWFKYVAAVELVLLTFLVLVVCAVLLPLLERARPRASVALAVAVVLVAPFVLSTHPTHPVLLDAGETGTSDAGTPAERAALADAVLEAAATAQPRSGPTALVTMSPETEVVAGFGQAWLLALTGRWTLAADGYSTPLVEQIKTDREATEVTRRLLDRDPQMQVLVPPAHLVAIRSGLHAPALASRVSSWSG